MWLKVRSHQQNIVVGTAYRPPWLDVNIFLDAITESVTSFSHSDGLILVGDFNINLLDVSGRGYRAFAQFIESLNLSQIVKEPTHFTDHSATLIDVVCTDVRVPKLTVRHSPDRGGHAMILAEVKIKVNIPSPRWVTYRPFKNILDHSATLIDVLCTDVRVPKLTVRHSPDRGGHAMILAEVKIKVDKPSPRWVTYRPLKNILIDQLNADLCAIRWGNFNEINEVNELVRAFTTCIIGLMDLHAPIVTKKFKNPPHPWVTDTVRAMMRIRDNYHNKYKKLKTSALKDCYRQMRGMVLEALEQEKKCYFEKHINSNIGNSKRLWRNLKNTVLPNNGKTIATIINCSLQQGVFPDDWKVAAVTPLPKTNRPASLQDLRPVSILPCLSKVLEKIVCKQLTTYLERHNILPELQSGFRGGHSTAAALADVVDNLLAAQDRGMVSALLLLDFSRAFDSINTSLLLSKLRFYGLEQSAIKWFHSYLHGRSQYVELRLSNGKKLCSQSLPVNRGVPQGSILGPILYILYSADIIGHIAHCRYHLYADDLQLYLSFVPCDRGGAVALINRDLLIHLVL
ncbi:uncharacterized protein LOC114361498 [Ostrinia furnacalis]|uniref:uncharacterized protein LOC114361498 n=1 Tax=Ostrinia furnacalis TaxID=93504 RepID=UPI001040C0A2|nr:uncharacterized protein LOC114361498 [Ostrinia furnacalis]